jgi:tRNA guanosine-2'-O-methyltransferase
MTLAFCIASCACQPDTNDAPCATSGNEVAKCHGDAPTTLTTLDLLDVLCILSERSKQHFNPKYRLKGLASLSPMIFYQTINSE